MGNRKVKNLKLNVAHYFPVWLPGTMTWLYQLVADLRDHCDNMVICEQTMNTDRFGSDNVFSFSELPWTGRFIQRILKKSGFRKNLTYFTDSLEKEHANLLHSHFGHIAVQGSRIAKEAGIPHVASFYGMDLHQIPGMDTRWKSRYMEMFTRTKRVFCEGEHMARSIEKLGCPPEIITVHPLGIDLDKVKFNPLSWNGKDPLRILIAASFREKKGIPLALKAVSEIRKSVSVVVTIIGDGSADPASKKEKKRILDTIKQLALDDIVDMKGYVSHEELLQIARLHHLFLSPSIHARDGDCEGGAPVGIIEMAASGLIVVSSRHCDIPGVVLHGETGWLSEEGDLADLVAKLSLALDQHDRWPEMATSARRHIASRFDARQQSLKLHNHYLEIVRE